MDKKHSERLKKLLEMEDFDDEVDREDDEAAEMIVIKSMPTRTNNPCGHEGQANCPMRCKVDNCSGTRYVHCHVNNCKGEARCNIVHGGGVRRRK